MDILLAVLASGLLGVSVLFSKAGMAGAHPYVVNAVTNTVILALFAAASAVTGTIGQLGQIDDWNLMVWSGAALAGSWVFYYLGLKDGTVGAVLALQNVSIIFTMVLGALILAEPVTAPMLGGVALIGLGTFLMTEQKPSRTPSKGSRRWIGYELISAALIALSFVLTKLDDTAVDTNAAGAVRYLVVAAMMWAVVLGGGFLKKGTSAAGKRQWSWIILGGALLGISYLLFYKSLVLGAVSVVTAIFRTSIIVSTLLSAVFLKEPLNKRGAWGLAAMTAGVVMFAL